MLSAQSVIVVSGAADVFLRRRDVLLGDLLHEENRQEKYPSTDTPADILSSGWGMAQLLREEPVPAILDGEEQLCGTRNIHATENKIGLGMQTIEAAKR